MARRASLIPVLFGTTIMLSAGTAFALNPQPLPPGRTVDTQLHNTMQEPPDPCITSGQANAAMASPKSHAVMHNGTHMTSGATTMDQASPKFSCAHRLNPQPLPPG